MTQGTDNLLRAGGHRSGGGRVAPWFLRGAGLSNALIRLWIIGLSLLLTASAIGDDDVVTDFQVKAAFLVSLPKYVDWPAAAAPKENSPITIAVFGDDNVSDAVAAMIDGGKTIEGHPVVLKRISREEDINDTSCQILFIAASERSRASAILGRLNGTAILTVGETDDFLDRGGVINLVHRGRKVRLQVNLQAAKQASLKFSSRLLVAADAVKGASN